jgi:hypothetical protein
MVCFIRICQQAPNASGAYDLESVAEAHMEEFAELEDGMPTRGSESLPEATLGGGS